MKYEKILEHSMETAFGNLKQGAIFRQTGNRDQLYMKVSLDDEKNAIWLSSDSAGMPSHFDKESNIVRMPQVVLADRCY